MNTDKEAVAMLRSSAAIVTLVSALLVAEPAYAANDSAYTDLDLDQCQILETDELGASFACPGYKGYPLWVAEGDLRMFVSYGFGAPDELAAHQTMPAFNYVGKKIEWRLTDEDGSWRPFATILRWYTQTGDGAPDGQILVVTKIEAGNTCHVAYVDAKNLALPGDVPNEIARNWADTLVKSFDCATDEPYYYPG